MKKHSGWPWLRMWRASNIEVTVSSRTKHHNEFTGLVVSVYSRHFTLLTDDGLLARGVEQIEFIRAGQYRYRPKHPI